MRLKIVETFRGSFISAVSHSRLSRLIKLIINRRNVYLSLVFDHFSAAQLLRGPLFSLHPNKMSTLSLTLVTLVGLGLADPGTSFRDRL